MTWMDNYYLADVAARVLADERPAKSDQSLKLETRMFMRDPAVRALRALWRNGDASNRATIAARVNGWLGHGQDRVKSSSALVLKRETIRLSNPEQKGRACS